MAPTKKVLILYASFGDGHRQVASALELRLKERGFETITIDLYQKAHPFINTAVRYVYLKSFGRGLSHIYGWCYYLAKDLGRMDDRTRSFFTFGIHGLRKIIQDEQPDAIVNTFPFAAVPVLVRKLGLNIRTYTVITDFDLHDLWIHFGIDKYFVATPDLKKALEHKGIPSERIRVTGIPLRPSFQTEQPSSLKLPRNGLLAKKNVLIMAGAFGVMKDTYELCESLQRYGDIHLTIVCGRNERSRNQLESAFRGCANVKVLGYVQKIAELMANSDCMVTKAGGITLCEAIAMELPMLIYRPFPGQERENALYLADHGGALLANKLENVVKIVHQILQDRQNQEMRQALQKLKQSDASAAVVDEITGDLKVNDFPLKNPITPPLRIANIVTSLFGKYYPSKGKRA